MPERISNIRMGFVIRNNSSAQIFHVENGRQKALTKSLHPGRHYELNSILLYFSYKISYLFPQIWTQPILSPKGRKPIQDQSSVQGADILNNQLNNYYGRSSNYPQRIQYGPKY